MADQPTPPSRAHRDGPEAAEGRPRRAAADASGARVPEAREAVDETRVPHAPGTRSATSRGPATQYGPGTSPWAHAALQDSFLDARINSEQWDTWGFRLVPDVKTRLVARLADDKRSADNRRLAQGHYINAAMLHLPDCVHDQLQMVRRFLTDRGGYTAPGKQSNYRVSRRVWQMARDLDIELTAASKRGLVIFLFSAAVERLMDALDLEGPLPRPEAFRRVR